MISVFNKMLLALVLLVGVQQVHADGDQTGLLANLYNAKLDYNVYMNKGSQENASLAQMLKQTYDNLKPFAGQQIQMSAAWAAPIRQTVAQFNNEFSVENNALVATFSNVDSVVQGLLSQKNVKCAAVDTRFQDARVEMKRVWGERAADSDRLLATLTGVAVDTEKSSGLFLVKKEWLERLNWAYSLSMAKQARYNGDLKALDARLTAIIEDVRVCYNLD